MEEHIWIRHWDQYEGFHGIVKLLVGTTAGSRAGVRERLIQMENDWAEFKAHVEKDGFESVVYSVESNKDEPDRLR